MDTNQYDSTAETLIHIRRVNELLLKFAKEIIDRSIRHDDSKLRYPEKELFDKLTPKLKDLEYGSDEYKECLKELDVALNHHYEYNSHHPQHYGNDGVDGMNLMDIVEMFFDWKAASERTKDGSITKSIEFNKDRFKLSDQLVNIFKNTVSDMNL
jgi:hypothetical protein